MNLTSTLSKLARDQAAPIDPAEVALLLARDEYPDLDVEAHLAELDGMAHEAGAYLRGDLPARVNGLCRYLFHDMGFRGNQRNYYDPLNSYLNQVLERRSGIPLTLSLVAMSVGNRAGLHVVGVGLPGHFVARAVEGDESVLFDPFHGGRQLTPECCERLVEQVTGRPFRATPASLEPVSLGALVLRMLSNLKSVYLSTGDFARAARVIRRLQELCPHDPLHHRDLGACLLRAGQPGKAIDHLGAYLHAAPQSCDAETVRQLLQKAQGEVAAWN
jgi:regulator of sirC expression with transglutaminase-like and TPR domain